MINAGLSFTKEMKAEKMWRQVHEANHHAIDFYKRNGFVQTGTDLYRAGKGACQVLSGYARGATLSEIASWLSVTGGGLRFKVFGWAQWTDDREKLE